MKMTDIATRVRERVKQQRRQLVSRSEQLRAQGQVMLALSLIHI